jgi:mannose-6-phosphate isomerase
MKFYPLKFKPIYKERIWGGQKLREVFGKDIPAGTKIGESWELADLPMDKSVIANGEFAGETLSEVLAKYPKEITGDENFSGAFPLLIKILDAEDILSVQVHPDAETCRRMGGGDAKTECWYIISAKPGAVIYKGLKEGVSREEFAEAIKEGTVAKLLKEVVVKAGECHFLPAGTTHAIGGGLLIAEIQMPSDTTYRVFDWNRVDESGKGRELHIAEALESIHFDPSGDDLTVTTKGRLVDSDFFKIDKENHSKETELSLKPGQMKTLIPITGSGTITAPNSIPVNFKAGQTLLIPAAFDGLIRFDNNSEYLTVTI